MSNSTAPHLPVHHQTHRRGPWTGSEDKILTELINYTGPTNWVHISATLGSRSAKQCRERWHQNLKPSLDHSPIRPEEGEVIEQMVNQLGKRWADIARALPNRSDNAVKNWWNGNQNRRKRVEKRRSVYSAPPHHHYSSPAHPYHHPQHTPSFTRLDRRPSADSYLRAPGLGMMNRPLPSHSSNHPRPAPQRLNLSHSYHGVETPLPSPAAYSPGCDSTGMPPSLMSDSSSYYTTSPRTADVLPRSPAFELPPLKNLAYHRPSVTEQTIQHNNLYYTDNHNHNHNHNNNNKLPALDPFLASNPYDMQPLIHHAPAYRESNERSIPRAQLPTAPASPMYQLPLPRPDQVVIRGNSEERVSRVKVNDLLC